MRSLNLVSRLRNWVATGVIAVLALGMGAAPASATLIFSLTEDGCTGGCGVSPFGTVTLTQVNTNIVNVQIDLTPSNSRLFVDTGGPHHTLAWNSAINMTISNVVGAATLGSLLTGQSASPFGSFNFAVDCTNCGPGASHAKPSPLSFNLTGTGLLESSFLGNAGGYFFAVDIISNTTGNTGNVAAIGTPTGCTPSPANNFCRGNNTDIPEPASLAVLGFGLLGLGMVSRRRRVL